MSPAAVATLARHQRSLVKWSWYNASAKGRERVERYRSTGKGIFARFQSALNERMREHATRFEELSALATEQAR